MQMRVERSWREGEDILAISAMSQMLKVSLPLNNLQPTIKTHISNRGEEPSARHSSTFLHSRE